jgi:hypothetical protein
LVNRRIGTDIDLGNQHRITVYLVGGQAIQETLYLLAVPGMRESIKEGMVQSTDTCAKELGR